MKKILFSLLTTLLVAFTVVACSSEPATLGKMDPYDPPFDTNIEYVLEFDEDMTIDGVLDEDVWSQLQNAVTATSRLERGGQMDMITYFGEKALYLAFKVNDPALYYEATRSQTESSGVEVYFSPIESHVFDVDCYSIRVTPTDKGEVVSSIYGYDITRWKALTVQKQYFDTAVSIDGTFNDKKPDNGYIVECGISYDLFGYKTEQLRLTGAFIQTSSAHPTVKRDANTFVSGSHYLRPQTWMPVSNDGIADKVAYLDAKVVADEDMTIDGVLDESVWTTNATKGKSFTYVGESATLKNATYTISTHMTDLGVYVGVDSTDKHVYATLDDVTKNTGIEFLIASKGVKEYSTANVKKLRVSVDGKLSRFDAITGTTISYSEGVFPVKVAGSVKNGQLNSNETDGWQEEIFIPWDSLGVERSVDKNLISILPTAIYHSANGASATAFVPVDGMVASNANANLRTEFIRFTKTEGNVNAGIEAFVDQIDTANTATINGTDCYYVDVDVAYVNAITSADFITDVETCDVLDELDQSAIYSFEKLSDGKYRLYIKTTDLNEFSGDGQTIELVSVDSAYKTNFNLRYDVYGKIDGALNALDVKIKSLFDNGKTAKISSSMGQYSYKIELAGTKENGSLYFAAKVTDSLLGENSAIELYVLPDGLLTRAAFMVKVYADGRYAVSASDGYSTWTTSVDYQNALEIAVSKNGSGYFVEGRMPLSVLRCRDIEELAIFPVLNFRVHATKTTMSRCVGDRPLLAAMTLKSANYLYFTDDGFAPKTLHLIDEKATLVKGKTYTGNAENGYQIDSQIKVSYLPYGGMESDSFVPIKFAVKAGEELPNSVQVTKNGLSARVELEYLTPDVNGVDTDNITTFINFNYGADNLITDEVEDFIEEDNNALIVDDRESSNAQDKVFNANMRTRWVRMPYEFNNEDFTVSMVIDGDALYNWHASTYAFLLFGTGNVDQKEGFSVQKSEASWYVRVPGKHYSIATERGKLRGAGYRRVTVSFDRTSTGAIVSLWLDYELQFTLDTEFTGSLNASSGKFGIGGPGSYKDTSSYPNVNVGIDDVIIYNTAIASAQEICDLEAYINYLNVTNDFAISQNKFSCTFNDFLSETQVSETFTITNAGVAEKNATFGGVWADAVVNNGDGSYTFTMKKADASKYSSDAECTFTVNGKTRRVSVIYLGLDGLLTDKTAYKFVSSSGNGGLYDIKIKLTSTDGIPVSMDNVYFRSTSGGLVSTQQRIGEGTYLITLNKSVADQKDRHEITVMILGDSTVHEYSFALEKSSLTAQEMSALGENLLAYVNYDGSNGISNLVGGTTSMTKTSSKYANNGITNYEKADGKKTDDKYFVADTLQNRMALDGINFGKEDFSISFDAKINSNGYEGSNAYQYELITSTLGTADFNVSTIQISVYSPSNTLRIQMGRNDGQAFVFTNTVNTENGGIKLDEWVNYTIVVDRNVATVEGRKRKAGNYNEKGEYIAKVNANNDDALAYLVEEDVTVSVYVDGKLFATTWYQLSGQDLGYNGKLFVGGNFGSGTTSRVAGIDNLIVMKGLLSEREINVLPYVCADLIK